MMANGGAALDSTGDDESIGSAVEAMNIFLRKSFLVVVCNDETSASADFWLHVLVNERLLQLKLNASQQHTATRRATRYLNIVA